MAGLNKVILIGNIGRDPETYEFENGNKKISFPLATTESYRDREGNWQDQTEWHNIAGYRYLAEKTIAKGDLVYVEGKIKTRKYIDKKDDVEKYFTEIIADKINILQRQNPDSNYQQESASTSSPVAPHKTSNETPENPPQNAANESNSAEDDLPF